MYGNTGLSFMLFDQSIFRHDLLIQNVAFIFRFKNSQPNKNNVLIAMLLIIYAKSGIKPNLKASSNTQRAPGAQGQELCITLDLR